MMRSLCVYTFIHIFIHVYGYQTLTDSIVYSELKMEYTLQGKNIDINETKDIKPTYSGMITTDYITACVANRSKTAIETALETISNEMVNREVKRSGLKNVWSLVRDILRKNDAYYDKVKQFYATSEDEFSYSLDQHSPVVHKSWVIDTGSTTGTWHIFVYPAMGPNDVCVEPVQSGQSRSATGGGISHIHVVLMTCCLVIITVYI